ncbi:MAG: glycosyltransferase family 39 protein [Dehalococcoidia bacterium]|nr:glycosyltransferase family 39 protein [Dehalococcoidia bacterium]
MSAPDNPPDSSGPGPKLIREQLGRAAAVRFTLVASAIVLAILADHFIRADDMKWAIAPLVIAVVCLALADTRREQTTDERAASTGRGRSQTCPYSRRFPADPNSRFGVDLNERTIGALAALCSIVLMFVALRNFGHDEPESLTLAWYSFGAAVALTLAAIPAMDNRWTALILRLKAAGGLHIGLRSTVPWLVLLAILVLAAGLRLYNLDDLPAGLWFDEADNLFHAREYAGDPGQIPVYEPSTNLPTMFLMPIAAVVKLAGVAITTPRLVAAAFGLLGIVATFLFVRHVLGASAALIAAFLVAVMRWDLNWSRIGMHGITGVLFAALTGWLMLRAIRTGRTSDFAFAGASLGLGMWFYSPFRMFPLVVGLILLLHLLVSRPNFRAYAANIATMAILTLFVAAPVAQYAMENSEQFFERTETTSLFNLTPREDWGSRLLSSLDMHVLMFNVEGDPNPRHNLPNAPMLDRITGALFVLGFFFALIRWRSVALFMLPFWVFFMVLPGVLTVPWEAPQSLRSILVIPAVAALAALVIDLLWRTWRDVPWSLARRIALPAILALLGIVAYLNVDLYFGDQANDPRVYAGFSTDETLMARSQVERQRLGYSLWVSRQFLFGLTSTLLANHPRVEVLKAPETLPLVSTLVWRGAAAYFEPRERGFWEVMKAYYPDAEFNIVTAPAGGDPMYYTGFVSREELASRQGLDATYTVNRNEVPGRRDSVTDSTWHPDAGPEQFPYRVALSGSLHVPEYGEYEFMLDSSHAVVDLNGQRVLESNMTTSRVTLASGLHELSIVADIEGPDGSIRVLWQNEDGVREPIPFSRLYRGSVRPVGLAGRFFEGERTSGVPGSMQVTPSMDLFHYSPVIPHPYTAVWEGSLRTDTLGAHRFKVSRTHNGEISLYVNNRLVAEDPPGDNTATTGELRLTPGQNRLRIEYKSPSGPTQFEVLWALDSGTYRPIPVELLTPAPEHMMQVVE